LVFHGLDFRFALTVGFTDLSKLNCMILCVLRICP
jgi:hypothetical protein